MTDDELAEELEFHAKHGIYAAPALQHEASERLYALSAHVALLKASLAQAEREAEKATASEEPFGYFRVTHFGWEDCAETDDGAIPLYSAPQPDFGARVKAGGPSFHEPGEGGVPCPDGSASEVGIPTSEPVAWAHFAKNGNIRIWTSAAKEAVRIAKENGIELIPLYTAPQPDRVAELERELREARAVIAKALEWHDRATPIRDVLRDALHTTGEPNA